MEICMIYIWYILCLHWCRLPWFRMEICRWWGKLCQCLSSSVWSVLAKWPPDCPSSVPRSPAATRSSPPLIGRDLVDHSGEEEGGLVVGGICTYQLLPHCTGDLTLLHCTQVHTIASIKHSLITIKQGKKVISIHQFMFKCKTVTKHTIFHVCSLGLFFLAKIFSFCWSAQPFE